MALKLTLEIEILINRVENLENQFNQFKQSQTSTAPPQSTTNEQPSTEQPKEKEAISLEEYVNILLLKQKKYTQQQMDEAIKSTWLEARCLDEVDYHHIPYKHKNFVTYKQSLNQ